MKRRLSIVAEIALLFGALFLTLPYIPSHEIARLPLLPIGAAAVALFAGSRLLRWRSRYLVVAIETALFALFVWGSNEIANLLRSL